MHYKTNYESPIGNITLGSDGTNLLGLWIEGQKYYLSNYKDVIQNDELQIFVETKEWLNEYFKGNNPSIDNLKLKPEGSEFQQKVWNELLKIPYGKTITYGDIANKLNMRCGQAVGGAVGRNPISIIIPCHRVIGKNGDLTGYAGGIDKKIKLLEVEKING